MTTPTRLSNLRFHLTRTDGGWTIFCRFISLCTGEIMHTLPIRGPYHSKRRARHVRDSFSSHSVELSSMYTDRSTHCKNCWDWFVSEKSLRNHISRSANCKIAAVHES